MQGDGSDSDGRTIDRARLLDASNSAAERIAALHLSFIAVCVYVLFVVFGTTDLDLLIGKTVKLPLLGLDVSLVAFFVLAPPVVLVVHFNLLLQLQLLSHKLRTLDGLGPDEAATAGWRDHLSIFAYTQHLIGRPDPLIRPLLGLMVSITVVLLPIGTLLLLQARFLAYQDEAVTWWQRCATCLDVAMLCSIWPLALHTGDRLRGYWREVIAAYVPRRRAWLSFGALVLGCALLMLGATAIAVLLGAVLSVVAVASLVPLRGRSASPPALIIRVIVLGLVAALSVVAGTVAASPRVSLAGLLFFVPLAMLWCPGAPRGSLASLGALLLVPLLSLAMLVDGEHLERLLLRSQAAAVRGRVEDALERALQNGGVVPGGLSPDRCTLFSLTTLLEARQLDLGGRVLASQPMGSEVLAMLRSDRWKEALQRTEPLHLHGRSLRNANLAGSILLGADLEEAHLDGAYLSEAQLQGANLRNAGLERSALADAQLQGAHLDNAALQDANLARADLRGATLGHCRAERAVLAMARLQGADLTAATLQDAHLREADLRSAILVSVILNGADVWSADFRGASMNSAHLELVDLSELALQGADLRSAYLEGANLDSARLDGAYLDHAQLQGATLQGAHLEGASLHQAQLQGADLRGAQLQGADLSDATLSCNDDDALADAELVDARFVAVTPLEREAVNSLIERLKDEGAPRSRGVRWPAGPGAEGEVPAARRETAGAVCAMSQGCRPLPGTAARRAWPGWLAFTHCTPGARRSLPETQLARAVLGHAAPSLREVCRQERGRLPRPVALRRDKFVDGNPG